jgi:hypothetical protein
MVRKEIKFRHHARSPQGLAAEMAMLSDEMRRAFAEAYKAYGKLGLRYVVCGGIAVGSYGNPRNTKDIDFLVGDEAFQKHGPLIAFAKPMPLQAYSVSIDPVPLPEDGRLWKVLNDALSAPFVDVSLGYPVLLLPATELAYMKLATPRSKDRGDVVEMIRTGSVDVERLAGWVVGSDELGRRLEAVLLEVEAEE